MRRLLVALLTVTACAPATSSASPSPSSTVASTPTGTAVASVRATPFEPIRTFAPTPTPRPEPVAAPVVVVKSGPFGIVTDLVLKPAAIDAELASAASAGVRLYLQQIDEYRDGSSPALPITGAFLDAVSSALKDSAAPGVQRRFELLSLKVDRHWIKPWGTHAYIDVTVSIADRAVGGTAPDQFEMGKLRLTGDRFRVSDGWDDANGRWFNGFPPLRMADVAAQIPPAVSMYLAMESWTPAAAPLDWRTGSDALPFLRARAVQLDAIDRSRIAMRLFENTTATIERFDTIEWLWSGLATVRLDGTLVTAGTDGKAVRTPFARRVKVFMFGGWLPEVVDEETTPGVWLSGGDLALDQVDVNRA